MPRKKLIEISIHLPLYYNPVTGEHYGKRIEKAKFDLTYEEIAYRFGGYSLYKNVEGRWHDEKGKVYKDTHHVLWILTTYNRQTLAWVRQYKRRLARRFEQEEIFITVSDVQRI